MIYNIIRAACRYTFVCTRTYIVTHIACRYTHTTCLLLYNIMARKIARIIIYSHDIAGNSNIAIFFYASVVDRPMCGVRTARCAAAMCPSRPRRCVRARCCGVL